MILEKGARIRALEEKEKRFDSMQKNENVKINRKSLDEIIQFYSYDRSIETLSEELHSQFALQSYPDVDSRIILCYVVGACADDL